MLTPVEPMRGHCSRMLESVPAKISSNHTCAADITQLHVWPLLRTYAGKRQYDLTSPRGNV
eukprot:26370-Eustigmatos_ZCMA.PRE.1